MATKYNYNFFSTYMYRYIIKRSDMTNMNGKCIRKFILKFPYRKIFDLGESTVSKLHAVYLTYVSYGFQFSHRCKV